MAFRSSLWLRRTGFEAGALVACGALIAAVSMDAFAQGNAPLPGLEFVPPAPGSYQLHRIMPAPEGTVVDVAGKAQKLSRFIRDKVTLLSFIYTSCTDAKGCPLAYRVFQEIKKEIQATPALHDRVRFVTVSFDPERDTPRTMRLYGGSHVAESKGLRWYFLTTPSSRELAPLLDGFGQDVRFLSHKTGAKRERALSHVLKVFLIDRAGEIREIYTTSYLYPEVVLNDIKTLLMEEGPTLQ